MPDRYDRSLRVRQSTIDEIKKMGMSDAIKRANSGDASAEFVEAAKRFYGGNKVKAMSSENLSRRQKEAESSPTARRAPSVGDKDTSSKVETKPISSKKEPSKEAVSRKISNSPPGLSRRNVAQIKSATEPISNRLKTSSDASKASKSHAADFWGGVGKNLGEKLGLNNPFKPRKRR